MLDAIVNASEIEFGEKNKSLRDEFAMSAMTGLAARDYRMGKSDQAEVVKIAYAIADQMIETRKK